jgi:predicted Zn-dependent protease
LKNKVVEELKVMPVHKEIERLMDILSCELQEELMDILSCELRQATDKLDKLHLNQKFDEDSKTCSFNSVLADKLASNEVAEVAFWLNSLLAQQVAYEALLQRGSKLEAADHTAAAADCLGLAARSEPSDSLTWRRMEQMFRLGGGSSDAAESDAGAAKSEAYEQVPGAWRAEVNEHVRAKTRCGEQFR